VASDPVLRVPLSQIDQEIGQQLDRGRQLLDAAPSYHLPSGRLSRDEKRLAQRDLYNELRSQLVEVNKWHEYTYELLRRRFSTDEVADQYKWTGGNLGSGGGDAYALAADFHGYIGYLVSRLESIRSRLDLYEPAPAPTAAAVQIQGSVYGSAIQAGSPGAHQAVSVGANLASVDDFLKEVERASSALHLPIQEGQELAAEIATIRAQLQSPKPKRDIVRESLRSVRAILEGAGSSLTATGLLNALQHVHF
jgi:hypothetical protein